jgi:hypothetical protein
MIFFAVSVKRNHVRTTSPRESVGGVTLVLRLLSSICLLPLRQKCFAPDTLDVNRCHVRFSLYSQPVLGYDLMHNTVYDTATNKKGQYMQAAIGT